MLHAVLASPARELALIAGGLVLLFVLAALHTGHRFARRHHPVRVVYRLATGHHLDGEHRSDRGWRRWGTHSIRKGGYPVSYLDRMPRFHRAGLFWAPVLAGSLTGYGWLRDPGHTLLGLEAAGLAGALVLAVRGGKRFATRDHRRTVVRPMAAALAQHFRVDAPVIARSLTIRPQHEIAGPHDQVGRLQLPHGWRGTVADRAVVEEIIAGRLPLEDVQFHWKQNRHLVIQTGAAPPPSLVTLDGYADVMAGLDQGTYLLGIGSDDGVFIWDAREQDPHAAIGARTRKGKSNALSAAVAQGLARGEQFTVIDPKRLSLRHFAGLPGFTLANDPGDPEAMVEAIHNFRSDMDAAIAAGDDRTYATLIIDEINQAHDLLREWWEDEKPAGARVGRSPVARDIRAILHQGGQFHRRVLVAGQDLKDESLFRTRSSFGVVLMSGYKDQQWRYVVGGGPVPAEPTHPGRFWFVRNGLPSLVQVVIADPAGGKVNEQAWRRFALNGNPDPLTGNGAAERNGWHLPRRPALTGKPAPLAIPAVLIGYQQAASYLGMQVPAFKKARYREPGHTIPGEFRTDDGRRPCWARDTLDLWRWGVRWADSPGRHAGRGT